MMKLKLTIMGLAVMLILSTGCNMIPLYMETVTLTEKDVPVADITELVVENSVGDIRVEYGETFSIVAKKTAHTESGLEHTQVENWMNGTSLNIRTVYTGGFSIFGGGSGSVEYTITIPETITLDKLSTSTGDVYVTGNFEMGQISSSVGDVVLKGATLTEGVSVASIETSTGSVGVNGRYLVGPISTSVGSIDVIGALSVENLETTTGDISAEIRDFSGDQLSVTSSTGDIVVRISGTLPCRVLSSTSVGKINNYGSFTDGTRRIEARTSTGDVDIYNL